MLPTVASRWPLGKRATLPLATECCIGRKRHLAGREARTSSTTLNDEDFRLSILQVFHGDVNLSKQRGNEK